MSPSLSARSNSTANLRAVTLCGTRADRWRQALDARTLTPNSADKSSVPGRP